MSEEDEKKEESVGGQIGNFIGAMIGITIVMLLILFSGSMLMYACKVAQSNILPTSGDCMPYSNTTPDVTPIEINANVTNLKDDLFSQKVNFDFESNKTNRILDYLRKMTSHPTQSGLTMYFITTLQDMLLLNYQIINYTLNFMNSSVSESLLIYLMPIVILLSSPFWLMGLFIINFIYFYYYLFSKLNWFFKKNANTNKNMKQEWKDILANEEPMGYITSLFLVSLFIIIIVISLLLQIPLVSGLIGFMILYVFGTAVSCSGKKSNGEDYTSISSLIDNTKFKKSTMMYIMSILLIITSFTKMGPLAGVFSVVAFILLYLQIVPIPIFVNEMPSDLSPIVSYEQAQKICEAILEDKPVTEPKKRSLLNRLTFGLLGKQSGGKKNLDLTESLKKMNELLEK